MAELATTAPYLAAPAASSASSSAVAVGVSLDGQTVVAQPVAYTYFSALLSALAPAGAPVGSVARLTLSGLGFVDLGPGAALCLFAVLCFKYLIHTTPF
jgi:hypothetical protein